MPKATLAREKFEKELATLVARFDQHRADYLRSDYSEAQVRLQFINPLFEALGWDVQNQAGKSRAQCDVIVERGETLGIPDYTFRLNGQTIFYVEAKAPHVSLEKSSAALQAKKYAWNTPEPFVYFAAATDFEEFRFYDASQKPDLKHLHVGLIFAYRYNEYLTPKALDDLWQLSYEAVMAGSLEKLLKPSARSARQRSPLDQVFLSDLTTWREQLAKSIFKIHPELDDPADLNNVVQIFLDRLIFIRVAEDRGVLEAGRLKQLARAWKDGDHDRSIMAELLLYFRDVNDRLNGEIFRKHRCEELRWESALVSEIVLEGLEPYDFNKIGVELLGSIYERYLGKTIRVTATRAVVEDKPEVRKAGGVYYTPKYIVDYIVNETVGKLIEGKTPAQISKLKILDPACGSGSFLIGAYQKLLDYHAAYLAQRASRRGGGGVPTHQARLLQEPSAEYGDYKLSLAEKAEILRNNIFGVDIDPQAVEITMMSLYIKMLEGERGAIMGQGVLPRLNANIKCGNSLIAHDIDLPPSDERTRINPFNWNSKGEGFGEIIAAGGFDAVIGNPPYIRMESFKELKAYLKTNYACHDERSDLYAYFIERGNKLINNTGRLGMIVSNKFLRANYGKPLRDFLSQNSTVERIVDFAGLPVFKGATVRTIVLIASRELNKKQVTFYSPPLPVNKFNLVANGSLSVEQAVLESMYEVSASALSQSVWSFAEREADDLLSRLQADCTPLTKYCDGQICMGIKSGLTEAFIIDAPTRSAILKRNSKAAEIIKPFVNGRDVRRYLVDYKDTYLIYTFHGVDFQKYPGIEQHLEPFKSRLRDRATRQEWYELQQPQFNFARFMDAPKIIFPDIATIPRFALDEIGYYGSNTTYFIPRRDLFLLGLLNSSVGRFYFVKTCAGLEGKTETYLRFFGQYLEGFPVRSINFSDPADKSRHDKMVALVERMLELHKQKQASKSDSARERIQREINIIDEQIDALVYELYGLTKDEIKIVENDK